MSPVLVVLAGCAGRAGRSGRAAVSGDCAAAVAVAAYHRCLPQPAVMHSLNFVVLHESLHLIIYFVLLLCLYCDT